MVGRFLAPVFAGLILFWFLPIARAVQPLSQEKVHAFGHDLRKDGQFQLAYEELSRFFQKYPRSSRSADAFFLTAECLHSTGRSAPARERSEALLSEFQRSSLRDDALFRLGEIHFSGNDHSRAEGRFREAVAGVPMSDLSAYKAPPRVVVAPLSHSS
jgi:TolA-binding protein